MTTEQSDDHVVKEAYVMSQDYMRYMTGRTSKPAPSMAAAALRHAGDDLLEKYPIFFKRWPRIFREVCPDNACDYLFKILDEHFQPEKPWQKKELTWSGILSIYVLAGQLAMYCQKNGMESVLEELEFKVGQYVERKVCPNIRDKGGWSGFIQRYAEKEKPEHTMIRACCGVLLLLGTVSLTYYIYRRRFC
ncbi:BCL2 like 16 [Heptranchias perlo]|uniref:BCL2 like 16 n=1 Tax=Heptranchias perlo TaxID=212740 RepID=UPI003559AE1A